MELEFKVQRAGLKGEWKTVCRNHSENYAREIYLKQLQLYSIGRFRLLDPEDKVLAEGAARPLFSNN
jgi:hypothetical protein